MRLAVFAPLALLVAAHVHAAERPPNVVLILGDDQAWTDFGFMGHPTIRTPHLDALAARSAVFERAYVPTSLCRPSLATLISGQYPHQHGITGNDPPRGSDRAEMLRHIRRMPKLPELLASRGYVSHQSGKWWEGSYALGGFTAGMTHGDPARGGRHGDEGLKIGRQGLQPIFDFVASAGDRPFFLWYAPFMPHTPHNPPERLLARYRAADRPIEIAKYYAMCEWFDETCGELLDHLDERGLTDSTLVVFVTDNGWIQRTPQTELPEGWRQPFAPRSKRSPYEGGIRNPILVAWPGRVEPARHHELVSSIDVAPTVLAAAGVEIPSEMPGHSLLDIAAGKASHDAVFGEIFDHDVVDIDDPAAGLHYRWCIEGDWKLILPQDPAQSHELYNVTADPHETKNAAAECPEIVAHLTQRIDEWWAVE